MRHLLPSLVLLLTLTLVSGQDLSLRGEVTMNSGVHFTVVAGELAARVPVTIGSRLELELGLGEDGSLRAVLLPAIAAGTADDDVLLRLGVQELLLQLQSGDVDLSLGFERLPLGELRLLTPLSIERSVGPGEPGGPLGARVTYYSGPWRVRAAALAVTGDDLIPDGPGAALSLRRESPSFTAEGHLLWTVRPAAGLTLSTSIGEVVLYAEGWLLLEPLSGRGGVGLSAYVGEDWLISGEAAWAAPAGSLLLEGHPQVALSASRPLGLASSLEGFLGVSWPAAAGAVAPSRTLALDAAVTLRHDQPDSTLSLTPALHLGEGVVAGSIALSLTSYL